MRRMVRFLRDDTAATAVEYCVMLMLVIMAVIAAVGAVGAGTGGLWGGANSKLQETNFGR
jgi:Flp pilus assembly pilin Flp